MRWIGSNYSTAYERFVFMVLNQRFAGFLEHVAE